MNSSSYFAFYFFKLGAVMFCVVGALMLHALFFPEAAVVRVLGPDQSLGEIAAVVAAVAVMTAISHFMFFKIRVIRYNDERVEIANGAETVSTSWENISSVSKVAGWAPPLYRMTFKDGTPPAHFIMSMFFFAYVIFWSWDFTGFYQYAQERIDAANTT